MKAESFSIGAESEKATPQKPVHPLDAVVEQVRRDAVSNSQEYLEETKVPHGGE